MPFACSCGSRSALSAAVTIAALAAGCAALEPAGEPISSRAIRIDAAAVLLNPQNPSETTIGDFHYAGGLALTGHETDVLHGLSDLDVEGTDALTAVGDVGFALDARLVLDQSERLVGLADARVTPLVAEDGRPLPDKESSDAEGVARLPNGDRVVSFERRHRILVYPASGGPPRPAPMPEARFPANAGMEALAADPESGSDAYIVGAEETGHTWTCRLSAACTEGPRVTKPDEFGLVAIARLPPGRTVYLLRAYDPERGARISLQMVDGSTLVARMDLARPMTVDNFEGLAAVQRADGGIRFYLLSDDNTRDDQRTLLLAFDWWPDARPDAERTLTQLRQRSSTR